jgi:ATP-dependent DNA helicase RecG
LGILHVQDILFHLPLRYEDRTQVTPIHLLQPGQHAVIEAEINNVSFPKGGKTRFLCRLDGERGRVHLRFFYMNALQAKALKPGVKIRCFGEVRLGPLGFEMIHPEYHVITDGLCLPIDENLTPIYPTTAGLSQSSFRKLTEQALQILQQVGVLQDILPEKIFAKFSFPPLKDALQYVHRPPPDASRELLLARKHVSQQRLAFEELLAHRLSLLHIKKNYQIQRAYVFKKNPELTQKFFQDLTFELTRAQKKVLSEIDEDLSRPNPMLRLVQGDVGSGKTVVAAAALLRGIAQGFQTAILAPTELLVEQHFRTFEHWLQPLNIKVVMLTSQMKVQAKRDTRAAIANGEAQVIVGTHAIFQKDVHFFKLAMIIVDEQHRFGVEQRALLREKGAEQGFFPHQLMMTATPIPRTLAMSIYADLDYSVIDELPPGRTPIKTVVVANTRREEILERIRESCESGRQVYWVCTLITDSEVLQCQTAEKTWELLKNAMPEFNIALLHGQMKATDKEEIMRRFKNGETHVLVATTVIEVGVDVPNASLMVIENAERLGLAQLHQLRGRVGRGTIESHCVLMYQTPLSLHAKDRLSVMRETNDGFKIAEHDLQLRGPGEVLGTRQTGDIALKMADLARDTDLFQSVTEAATILQEEFPETVMPLIQRWLSDGERFARV